jgi:hypothetical protein
MATDLTYLPFYLSTSVVENLEYGCDDEGLWFAGEGAGGYPIKTNVPIPSSAVTEVVFIVDHNYFCSDQGICFYNLNDNPEWDWGTNSTRIAFSINCPEPYIYGKTVQTSAGEILVDPEYFTFKVTYNPTHPTDKVVAVIYQGKGTDSDPLSTISIDEALTAGNYGVGIGSDNDESKIKSYYKYLSIKVDGVDIGLQDYTMDFDPANKPVEGGEGSLDTSLVNGHSIQRTGYLDIQRSDIERKVVNVADGQTISNSPNGLGSITGIIAL